LGREAAALPCGPTAIPVNSASTSASAAKIPNTSLPSALVVSICAGSGEHLESDTATV
jgi:hypothetical protein